MNHSESMKRAILMTILASTAMRTHDEFGMPIVQTKRNRKQGCAYPACSHGNHDEDGNNRGYCSAECCNAHRKEVNKKRRR